MVATFLGKEYEVKPVRNVRVTDQYGKSLKVHGILTLPEYLADSKLLQVDFGGVIAIAFLNSKYWYMTDGLRFYFPSRK